MFSNSSYNGACISEKSDRAMIEILKQQEDNDKLPRSLPSIAVCAHKTGELEGAIHDGGIIYGSRRDFIICVMTENVSNLENVTGTISNISSLAYKYYNMEPQ